MRNVPRSLFGLVDFCFLLFLRRTSVQKWKKIWFCYVHKWIGKKEMSAKIIKVPVSKPVHRSRNTNQSCVQRSRNPRNFQKVYYFVFFVFRQI